MPRFTCMIQAGQISAAEQRALAEGLRSIGRELLHDPPEGAEVTWLTIRAGFGFSAGKPSTSSLVARSVPHGLPQTERKEFMTRVSDLWRDTTGCTANEIVVTAVDGPAPH
jgi:phenylpyruvate tautomerase PptA (4-oxalocrotonate tautomerase family)